MRFCNHAFFCLESLHLYKGLTSLSFIDRDTNKDKWIEITKQSIASLKSLCVDGPMNFSNKCALLEAELARLQNHQSQAKMHYDKAICLSNKHNFIHEEALACELAAAFYLDLGVKDTAIRLLLQSHHCYERWGAIAKTKQLTNKYPFLVKELKKLSVEPEAPNSQINHSFTSISYLSNALSSSDLSMWGKQKRLLNSLCK